MSCQVCHHLLCQCKSLQVVTLPAPDYMACEELLKVNLAAASSIASVAIVGFRHDGHSFLDATRLTSKDALWLSEVLRKYALEIM